MSHDTEIEPRELRGEGQDAEAKAAAGPFGTLFPCDLRVWSECRRLVGDKNIRVEDLATCASQDPVIVIELLRTANAMFFSGGRSPITSSRTAIVRLGSDVVLETLEKLRERPGLGDENVAHWLEVHRSRCRRTSIIARLLAEAVARQLADDCQAVGLLINTGEMLAVAHLREDYVRLAEEHSRSGVNFRLAQDYRFDVEKMGLTYLRRNGIPEALLFALDRDGRARTNERGIMKPVCMGSAELVDAFDTNRWEKLAPGKSIPPKSALRMLQLNDQQYLKIYERASEYLFSARLVEEKNRLAAVEGPADGTSHRAPPTLEVTPITEELQDEIQLILRSEPAEQVTRERREEVIPAPVKAPRKETIVHEVHEELDDKDAFSLTPPPNVSRVARIKKSEDKPHPAPTLHTSKGTKMISNFASAIDSAKTSEELLAQILEMLVDKGPFEKSALMVVSKDRKNALVVAARGPSIGNGQRLALDDELSPIAQCFSKVQSFGNKESKHSPFGSKSFALSPIDADHQTPVVLYADCGNEGSLTFEARRVFRVVVEILNQRLPEIPGGIPVEL